MNIPYAYTPHIWPSVLTILLLIVLAFYSWRRRSVPGALPFGVYCLLSVPMLTSKIIAYLAIDFETKVFWFKVENVWWMPIITALTCFCLEYAQPGRWLTHRNLALLSIFPLLCLVFLPTNDSHHLLFRGFGFNGSVVPLYGPVGWIFLVYVLGLTVLNFIVFAWLFHRSPQHRWPVVLILAAQLFTRALAPFDPYIRDSWFFYIPENAFTVTACTVALFCFRIFDPLSLARRTMIAQLHEGVLVLDSRGRVTNLNPAAEGILGMPEKQTRGRTLTDLLPAAPHAIEEALEGGNAQGEILLGAGPETCYYRWETSTLKDWRGLLAGYLFLMHDVTGEKRIQAQLVEQQRALAMLHEREQLARELHDSLSQMLGYTGIQLEAACQLILDGRLEAGTTQLNRLAGVVREVHTDVREYILDLHAAPLPQQPFFIALRRYLEGFTTNYGIQTRLNVDEGLSEQPLPPDARMQVFASCKKPLRTPANMPGPIACR